MAEQWRSFIGWLDRSTLASDKKVPVFILSFLASNLMLVTNVLYEQTVAIIFVVAFILLLIFLLLLVREQESVRWQYRGRELFQTRWGTFAIAVLGFGLGAEAYHKREWFKWLWDEFRKIDKPDEWILVSLFLLGVMLGFFVVRNWSKSQQDFTTSITAVLGAAFLATILGTLANKSGALQNAGHQTVTTDVPIIGSTAAPGSGGTSGTGTTSGTSGTTTTPQGSTTGAPTATPSATPPVVRTVSQTTPASVSSPENLLDPVTTFSFYALGFTLSGTLNLIVFALLVARYTRTQSLTSRSVIDFLYGSDKAKAIDLYFLRNFEADPNYAKSKLVAALSEFREGIRYGFARQMNIRKERAESVGGAGLAYFELMSVKSIEQPAAPDAPPPAGPSSYEIMFRRLRKKSGANPGDRIDPSMFRVSITLKWRDNLEYIVATGEYRKSFPYYGSVAGMSLLVRRTIVMNRDKNKKFRTGDFVEGKTPSQADQPRGLYRIDYLSYICVPMASGLGKPEEESLGVLHVDTKLFAAWALPEGSELVDEEKAIYKIVVQAQEGEKLEDKLNDRLREFENYASNLYKQNDPVIEYLEKLTGVVVPLLELYKKCRTGAFNEPTTTPSPTPPTA